VGDDRRFVVAVATLQGVDHRQPLLLERERGRVVLDGFGELAGRRRDVIELGLEPRESLGQRLEPWVQPGEPTGFAERDGRRIAYPGFVAGQGLDERGAAAGDGLAMLGGLQPGPDLDSLAGPKVARGDLGRLVLGELEAAGIDAIRNDPAWSGGEYKTQPPSLRTTAEMLWFMSSNPVLRQKEAPTLRDADDKIDKFVADYLKTGDANDVLYALEASHDYDPGPALEKIRATLLAINSADDLINPPELGIHEREIQRLPHGRAIVIPLSDKTRGHGSHTIATLWKDELAKLLKESAK